ncbi:DNA-binding response regulator [Flavimobilis marinus]|uniref:DNA-binding response regulator, OmpR family, contains REC and winged-helix (WHTH) domain n=1 Tax=Flavimobilis marinus TaxID=285351 RepID=A0A1I2HW01_9MICO|nr:response regulator transcription factor [Flavimobilis marinus]GHG49253.1 DNA-binding response regulator [Flavimobilis marinus]SFF33718.1 DNA-binding response regulator, OmpR family, contains REC and winged-helix (wHTH) domain [Flavimobilis marinus]
MTATEASLAPVALVVDDEPQMRAIVTFALETQGFRCLEAGSAERAWELVETTPLDLVVLDVMLPGEDGIALCRRIREGYQVPVILLTARSEVGDRVEGLESGADDYLTKPFSPRELALRAQAVVRRSRPAVSPGRIVVGSLEIDLATMRASDQGEPLQLSVNELRLLVALASRPGEPIAWRDLVHEVWATVSDEGGREMLKTAVYRLRSRLEADPSRPERILTVRGVGYRMLPR